MNYYALCCQELPEREKSLRDHLGQRGISAIYWRGFHGRTWGLSTTLEYEPGKSLPSGHVGLNLGTWALWQYIWLSGEEKFHTDKHEYTIFEDDVDVPVDFGKQLGTLRDQLRHDFPEWDLVFLGSAEVQPNCWNKVTERIGMPDSRLCRLNDPFGTHAIMLRRRALPVLLENMRAAHRNLDQQLWERVLKKGLLNWCAVLPSIVTQRTFDYTGTGKPEWAPSCIDASDTPTPGLDTGENVVTTSDPAQRAKSCEPSLRLPNENRHHGDVQALLTGREIQDPLHITPEMDAAILQYSDPLPCFYRGRFTSDVAVLADKRTVPIAECARFRKPCYIRPGMALADWESEEIISCDKCSYRVDVTPESERTRLPLPEGHFNCSFIKWQGRVILASRDSWGHSKVALWEMSNSCDDWNGEWSCKPIASLKSDHKDAPRLEDPRLFIHQNKLHAMFSLPDGYPPKVVQVGYCRFSDDLKSIEETVVYESPNGNKYEKNWMPISEGNELRWVYATKPEHIIIGETETWRTKNPLPWTGGVLRGGATPVLRVNGRPDLEPSSGMKFNPAVSVYYHFTHGCLKRLQGSVYSMGCTVFEAKPPYRVLRQTPVPLIWPDSPRADESVVKRYVVFPGGAIPHAGAWNICMGVDDTYTRIVRLPFETVEAALKDAPEQHEEVSLTNSVMATGGRK